MPDKTWSPPEIYQKIIAFICRCGEHGRHCMVLNLEKFKFTVQETNFAAFRVRTGKVKPAMESHVE